MTPGCAKCLDSKHKPHYRFRFKDFENNYLNELRKNRSTLSRVIWLILFLAMIAFALYIAIQLLLQYMDHASYDLAYSTLANSYTLPAITICNLNPLDYLKMKDATIAVDGVDKNLYTMYKNLIENYKDPSGAEEDESYDFEGIETIELFEDYHMEPSNYYIPELTTFARSPVNNNEFLRYAYTSSGMCLEINDDQSLVQKVGGVAGGLHMVLDTRTDHYLPETEDQGFRITFRAPMETVLDQQYGFVVSPGNAYYINVRTMNITRLESPWGTCVDLDNIFDGHGRLTLTECFLNQILWMHTKLHELGCGCFPWFFYQRYYEDTEGSLFDEGSKWRLIRYWTEDVEEEFRFDFKETCQYVDTYMFTSKHIETVNDVLARVDDCIQGCKDHADCRYFMYSSRDNDIMKVGECRYFETKAQVEPLSESDDPASISKIDKEGYVRGDTKCLKMDRCTPVQTEMCKYEVMKHLTYREGDKDPSTGKSNVPPSCHEPCFYQKFEYAMSSTTYPTQNYWNAELSETVTRFADYDTAKHNLVKLVFYTDVMKDTQVIQTASYEITSFISEMGGLTDLLMGFSFYTVYQFGEWILTLLCTRKRKTTTNPDGNGQAETIAL